jgi:hypothetical protein
MLSNGLSTEHRHHEEISLLEVFGEKRLETGLLWSNALPMQDVQAAVWKEYESRNPICADADPFSECS